MMGRIAKEAGLTLVGALAAHAQVAQAQSINCPQLQYLQESGRSNFADITGEPIYEGYSPVAKSTYILAGAETCEVDYLDTSYPSYKCVWAGYAGQSDAETARLSLLAQVKACLPAGYKMRDRASNLKGSDNYYTLISFNSFQPKIKVSRRYVKVMRRFSVELEFQLDNPDP